MVTHIDQVSSSGHSTGTGSVVRLPQTTPPDRSQEAHRYCVALRDARTELRDDMGWKALSPDDRKIASIKDNAVRVEDLETGRCKEMEGGHAGHVQGFAWLPDGCTLALLGVDNTVKIWSVETGKRLRTFEELSERYISLASRLNLLEHIPANISLALGGVLDALRRVLPGLFQRIALSGHGENITRIAWSPNGKRLASVSRDASVRVWDTETGDCEKMEGGHTAAVLALAWSPDGRRLATGGVDGIIKIWSVDTGKLDRDPEELGSKIIALAWSPDGQRLACAPFYQTVEVWDIASWDAKEEDTKQTNAITKDKVEFGAGAVNLAWSPDGEQLALGCDDGIVRIAQLAFGRGEGNARVWNVRSVKPLVRQHSHRTSGDSDWVLGVAWSPDGQMLASSSASEIRLWDAKTLEELRLFREQRELVTSISFSADGRWLASKSIDGTVLIWSTDSWKSVVELDELWGLERELHKCIAEVAFHPTEPVLATLGRENTIIRIWDLDLDRLPPTGSRLISEASVGETSYRFKKPERIELESSQGRCVARGMDGAIEGVGEDEETALRNWKYRLHIEFQRLCCLEPFEMLDEDKTTWKKLVERTNLTEYKKSKPTVIRQLGKIIQTGDDAYSVDWMEGKPEPIDLARAPANFARLQKDDKFEAIVRRDSDTWKTIRVHYVNVLVTEPPEMGDEDVPKIGVDNE